MHPTEADLSPDQRRREIASILATGVLRLSARPEAAPALSISLARNSVTDSPLFPVGTPHGA